MGGMSAARLIGTVSLAVLLLADAGCGKHQAPPARRGRHPDARRAVAEVVAALERSASVDPAERMGELRRASAALYVEPRCRDAWLAAPVDPASLVARIASECAAAYCPLLPAPKPAACTAGARDAGDMVALWAELQLAILTLDLGPEAALDLATRSARAMPRLQEAMRAPIRLTPADLPPPCVDPQGHSVETSLLLRGDGAWVGASSGERRFIGRCRGELDAAALAVELCALNALPGRSCNDDLEIAAEPSVAYADVIQGMDAAIAAGLVDVGINDLPGLSVMFPRRPAAGETAPARCGQPPPPCGTKPVVPTARLAPPVLPAAATNLEGAPTVTVTAKDISLDGKRIASTQLAGMTKDWRIMPLLEGLEATRAALEASSLPEDVKRALRGVLIVRASPDVDAGVLNRVMKTASLASYSDIQFATEK